MSNLRSPSPRKKLSPLRKILLKNNHLKSLEIKARRMLFNSIIVPEVPTLTTTVLPEATTGSTIVFPEATIGSTTVFPEATTGSTAVLPEATNGSTAVRPEATNGSTTVRPEATNGSTTVLPEATTGSTAVLPASKPVGEQQDATEDIWQTTAEMNEQHMKRLLEASYTVTATPRKKKRRTSYSNLNEPPPFLTPINDPLCIEKPDAVTSTSRYGSRLYQKLTRSPTKGFTNVSGIIHFTRLVEQLTVRIEKMRLPTYTLEEQHQVHVLVLQLDKEVRESLVNVNEALIPNEYTVFDEINTRLQWWKYKQYFNKALCVANLMFESLRMSSQYITVLMLAIDAVHKSSDYYKEFKSLQEKMNKFQRDNSVREWCKDIHYRITLVKVLVNKFSSKLKKLNEIVQASD